MGTVVGEMLASAVLKVVMGKLGAVIGPEVNMLWKFKDDLESIRSTLLTLQAVLNDAEKRSSREERVRLWLKRLKFAAYDIHDILEEMESNNDIGYGSFKKRGEGFSLGFFCVNYVTLPQKLKSNTCDTA